MFWMLLRILNSPIWKKSLEFVPIAQTNMFRLKLEKRKQLPDKQSITYINEVVIV